MSCKFIKLLNGEGIVATVLGDSTDKWFDINHIQISNPLAITSIKIPHFGTIVERFIFIPWISISEDVSIDIPTKNILAVIDVKKEIQEKYESFINESVVGIVSDDGGGNIDESDTEEDLRLSLESFLNITTEDEEEDDGRIETRTIH